MRAEISSSKTFVLHLHPVALPTGSESVNSLLSGSSKQTLQGSKYNLTPFNFPCFARPYPPRRAWVYEKTRNRSSKRGFHWYIVVGRTPNPQLTASSHFIAPNATFALYIWGCCLRFDMPDLMRIVAQQTASCSSHQCPDFKVSSVCGRQRRPQEF